jgi:hypothetical protein
MDKNITVAYEESQIIRHAVPATRQAHTCSFGDGHFKRR